MTPHLPALSVKRVRCGVSEGKDEGVAVLMFHCLDDITCRNWAIRNWVILNLMLKF
jgi:hypothetical protein